MNTITIIYNKDGTRKTTESEPLAHARTSVLWRKKGCKTCKPIVVSTRATIVPATP